jgi:hypothetical protein
MKKLVFLIVLIFLIVLVQYHFFKKPCGVERWKVKILADADTSKINFSDTIITTVTAQGKLKPPKKIYKELTRRDDECYLLQLDCYIIQYKKEDDKDYHVVIKDLYNDNTMVSEIPSPVECGELKESGHYAEFGKVRTWFEQHIGVPTDRFKKCIPPVKVRMTGIGFFDFNHGQTGHAPNGREIHPVLKIECLN